MTIDLRGRSLVLIGCGKMGGALLDGWLAAGIAPSDIHVVTRSDRPDLSDLGVHVRTDVPDNAGAIILAVKPQAVAACAPLVPPGLSGLVVISVAAGIGLDALQKLFSTAAVVRAMPNTPASIRMGITSLIAAQGISQADIDLATELMRAVGEVVVLSREEEMDAATALAGSGPAYVFHMIEAMAAAGEAHGLDPIVALDLARHTAAGAGMLAVGGADHPAVLRANVTSPNGTTAAGLAPLMVGGGNLTQLMEKAISAATFRSRELSNPS